VAGGDDDEGGDEHDPHRLHSHHDDESGQGEEQVLEGGHRHPGERGELGVEGGVGEASRSRPARRRRARPRPGSRPATPAIPRAGSRTGGPSTLTGWALAGRRPRKRMPAAKETAKKTPVATSPPSVVRRRTCWMPRAIATVKAGPPDRSVHGGARKRPRARPPKVAWARPSREPSPRCTMKTRGARPPRRGRGRPEGAAHETLRERVRRASTSSSIIRPRRAGGRVRRGRAR